MKMNKEKAQQIANAYNKRMRHLFKGDMKYHSTDVETIMSDEWSSMWTAVEPFLDNCERVWMSMKCSDPKLEDVQFPSIGVFSRWGVLRKLYDGIGYYNEKDLKERIFLIWENKDMLGKYIDLEGWSVNISAIDVEFYKGDPKLGDSYPPTGKQKELIYSISSRIKDILHV